MAPCKGFGPVLGSTLYIYRGSTLPLFLLSFNSTEIPFGKGVWQQTEILQSKMIPLPPTRNLCGLCPDKLIHIDNFKQTLLDIQCSDLALLWF